MTQNESQAIGNALKRITDAIDVNSSVPVSVQLRGALEYGIATGELPASSQLPSVRRFAAYLGLSPVTVSGVYAVLQERGHIEGRVGCGTFVVDRGKPSASEALQMARFEKQLTELICAGEALGLSCQDIAFRVSIASARQTVTPLRVLMLATFRETTEAYAEDLRQFLDSGDEVVAWSVDRLEEGDPPVADLVCCPHTMTGEASRLFPQLPVVGLTLIPNGETRVALATMPPEATVLVVSFFDDFLALMKSGVARFAPHVNEIIAVPCSDSNLEQALKMADVVIYSSGAGYLRDTLRANQNAIEYRHTPDSNSVRRELLPAIESARSCAVPKEIDRED
ncbi:GntR family transcriptional regulator [Granulosicoccus antarcticus]|uniref:HTH-type transcriptional repressor YtrA n=1 Tax=Granulosicoccus antarcticus IMCC3135 TaxID=1192854 RepID=A0A2Z2NND9_9GAMM|nr:GntR family transcriptional regulator [Granulosicoccus antarcticus]ASJ72753.1 HTH-type transcriptional repressor YtrA [Granulosicoccus antarcticus IMCC3135]